MIDTEKITNVVIAGLGGQGVIRAANILAETAFRAGFDVKQGEIHGMSQRGGSVSSDVRFGKHVYSPMVPIGEADYLMVLHPTQVENNLYQMGKESVLLDVNQLLNGANELSALDADTSNPITERNCNVALLGMLSTCLPFDNAIWEASISSNLPAKVVKDNIDVFYYGQTLMCPANSSAGQPQCK